LIVVPFTLIACCLLLPQGAFLLRNLELLLQFGDQGLEGSNSRREVHTSAYLGTQRGGGTLSATESIDVFEDRKKPRW